MSSFLDRFEGRTQTVSKLGIEQLFRGRDQTTIYTNTHKSFAPSSTNQLRPQKPRQITASQQQSEEEQPFHLPHLQQRYLNNNQWKRMEQAPPQSHSRIRIDRETNWLVEQPQPQRQPSRDNGTILSVAAPKEKHNLSRTQAKQEERRFKSHHHQSISKLGGLGPNIGGEEWTAKRQKQQKAKKYADELKRIQRQRMVRESESLGNIEGNRVVINY